MQGDGDDDDDGEDREEDNGDGGDHGSHHSLLGTHIVMAVLSISHMFSHFLLAIAL